MQLYLMIFLRTVLSNANSFQTDLFDPLIVPYATTIPRQSGSGSNGNKGVLHTTQISRTRA